MKALWGNQPARRYLGGQTLSLFGDSAMWLAAGIWVRTLTGSNAAAAVTVLCFTAPAILAPAAGLLADRVRRRPLLVVANVAGAAMVAPLLLVDDRTDVWLIYTVIALYGFLNVLIAPAQTALLSAILPAELLADANAALRTVQEGLRIVAPLCGAGLFTLVGGRAVVVLDMATFIGAALLIARLPNDRKPSDGPQWNPMAGFRFIAGNAILRRVTIGGIAACVGLGLVDATVYAVITAGLHRPPAFAGVTQLVQGLGAVAGGLVSAPAIRRLGEVRVVVAGLALLACAPALSATAILPGVLGGQLITGASIPPIVVAVITLLQRQAPAHLQGRVYAALEVSLTGPQTAGVAAGAVLLGLVDYRLILAGAALLLASSAFVLGSASTREPGPVRDNFGEVVAKTGPQATTSGK
jgi:MFS family permease